MTLPRLTIGLLWHSMNSDNLGVGALTIGQIAIVPDLCKRMGLEPRFIVLCWTDPRPHYFDADDIEVIQLRMSDILLPGSKFTRAVRRCNIVLDIGAGDSFADIYGASRILKMIAGQNVVLAVGKPLVLSPQTIGPFKNPIIRRLALSIMRRARAVVTRDQLSSKFATDMGFTGRLIEATDVALRLPCDPPGKRPKTPVRIGLNVSALMMNGGYTRDNMFGLTSDYPSLINRLIAHFADLDTCQVHLIGHVIDATHSKKEISDLEFTSVEDDYQACRKLAIDHPSVVVAPPFNHPSAAKSYIASMDFMMGARMHATIAAFSSGVPVVPIAYSRKFAGMFGTIGYDTVVDCTSETNDEIFDKVLNFYAMRKYLKEDVDRAMAEGLRRLKEYEAILEECFREIVG